MFKHRLFNLCIAIALAVLSALTIREAAATAGVLAQIDAVQKTNVVECASLPSRHSIHTQVVNGIPLPYTEEGPTGVDGGLAELLKAYRACSQ